MFAGFKLSESTLVTASTIGPVTSDVLILTGTTTVNTIVPPQVSGGQTDVGLFIVTTGGAVTFGTTGNIAVATTTVQNRITFFVYSSSQAKWFPGPID